MEIQPNASGGALGYYVLLNDFNPLYLDYLDVGDTATLVLSNQSCKIRAYDITNSIGIMDASTVILPSTDSVISLDLSEHCDTTGSGGSPPSPQTTTTSPMATTTTIPSSAKSPNYRMFFISIIAVILISLIYYKKRRKKQ